MIKFITNLDENDFNPTEKNAIYLLFRELLNNSIKHGSAEKIEIQIIQHEDGYVLMFEDNGKGFEPSLLAHSRGKGFRNMQTRVDELGGKLYIDSRPGRGATITVDLPRMIQNASYHDN